METRCSRLKILNRRERNSMIESTVDVSVKIRIPVKTKIDPRDYTIKEWKLLLAKQARKILRTSTIEELTKGIRKYDIVYREDNA